MDKTYADTVRLLLSVAPDVFQGANLAMKGGTAINLFVRDMPRLRRCARAAVLHAVASDAHRSAGPTANGSKRPSWPPIGEQAEIVGG